MRSRGFAVCFMLALASIAQAGATVQFVFDPPVQNNCLVQNTQYTVDVQLLQDVGGSDQRLRMVELDLQTTSAFFNISFPTTHDKGTPSVSDDIRFWQFGSLSNCQSTPSFCGFNHYVDFTMAAGPVDTRANVLSAAYFGLSVDNTAQLLLTGGASPTPLTVGRLLLTPTATGSASLNVMNQNDADPNRRARVDFGFDPHLTWRVGNASPNNLSGGIASFDIQETCGIVQEAVLLSSVPPFTGVGIATPPAGGTLWRSANNTIRLTFDRALPGVPTAGQIQVNELLANAFGPDLSANGFTFTLESGNTVLKIVDGATTDLIHRHWYAIRNTGGWAGVADFEAQFPVQEGDASGDNRVLQADVGFIASNVACVSGCGDQNRSDINGDGRVLQADAGTAATRVSSLPVAKPAGH